MLAFGDCMLDLDRVELQRRGEQVALERQVFDVLRYLVEHRDRVVPKTELLDAIWGDRFVSESALTSRIKSARKAIGDTGRDQRMIRTVHGVGYRFVVDAREVERQRSTGDDQVAAALASLKDATGGAWEVVGAAGAGKQALVDRVVKLARDEDFLLARATAALVDPRPFSCVVDAFRELVRRDPLLLDDLSEPCRTEMERYFDGAEILRERIFAITHEMVAAAAARGGAVVAVEDAHYADPATVGLLRHLGRLAARYPLFVVVTHRPGLRIGDELELVELTPRTDGESRSRALEPSVHGALQRVALVGDTFDVGLLACAAGVDDDAAGRMLDIALVDGVVEPVGSGFRFTDAGAAERLAAELPSHHRAAVRAEIATRLSEAGAPPARVASLLLAAGATDAAMDHVLAAARRSSQANLHEDVLHWTATGMEHARGAQRVELLSLRAQTLALLGDPGAVHVYRLALLDADADAARPLRIGLARAALAAGDLETAEDAIAGIDPAESDQDGPVLLVKAALAYFRGELDTAEQDLGRARALALVPGAPGRLLDAIAFQGMVAHSRGQWFDRLRHELRATKESPELATAVFDSHLCVAEYLLYGPTPYEEVIRLARDLREAAERAGARRGAAFAVVLAGEAELLAGDLAASRRDLGEGVRLHRELGASSGEAHSLQRLAEVELAAGNRAEAERLARRALPLARWALLSRHLIQRVYGTLIAAAPDAPAALAVVDEATQTLDEPSSCEYCDVMLLVPSSIACAHGGRLDDARQFLTRAEASAALWEGTAWQAAMTEARACISAAEGDDPGAARLLADAARLFETVGQPLDAARCREAAGD